VSQKSFWLLTSDEGEREEGTCAAGVPWLNGRSKESRTDCEKAKHGQWGLPKQRGGNKPQRLLSKGALVHAQSKGKALRTGKKIV